jgi:hypothetical protein
MTTTEPAARAASTTAAATATDAAEPWLVTIRPWHDPVVDRRGWDPRGAYPELFWLGVIGPTALWVLRRFARGFDEHPEGFTIDLVATARSMGLSAARGVHSPFGRALQRCVMFGLVQPVGDGYLVRRRLPDVSVRHLGRLPAEVRERHDDFRRSATPAAVEDLARHLIDAGIPPDAAATASELALRVA